jgi:Uma2 family endonuclease
LVAIEILSPEDRHLELMQKLQEYKAWGVPHVWLVDPERHTLHIYSEGALTEVSALPIPEFDVQLTGAEIFG